jgi:UDP-glucose 4-epimerase
VNWLITGGCGFIGTNLVASLAQRRDDGIRVVDNLRVGTREALASVCAFDEIARSDTGALPSFRPGRVQLVVGDIMDAGLAVRACVGAGTIVHLAANTGVAPSLEDPRADCEANVLGVLNYLEAARQDGVPRFVFASSSAPIGQCEPPIHEELAPHPMSPYGASKLAGEGYCSAYFHSFGVETVALRFGNAYGPRSLHKSSVVAKFIGQALRGETLEVYGDGEQTRIYVDDIVDAIVRSAQATSAGGELFQIATHTETSVRELLEQLRTTLARQGCDRVTVRFTEPRRGDMPRNYSDTRKARRMLNWTVQVRLEEGLERTLAWFLAHRA